MKVLTWNISNNQLSAGAPESYIEDYGPYGNTFEIVREIEKQAPDIFTLQEIPHPKFCLRFQDYSFPKPISSHSGWLTIFYSSDYTLLKKHSNGPWLACKLMIGENMSTAFWIVACHLVPFDMNHEYRYFQIKDIIDFLDGTAEPMMIIGDMNMREKETPKILKNFDLQDQFLECGTESEKFSWDAFINHYYKQNNPFKARFDRIFTKGFSGSDFLLTSNTPVSENPYHYISDHFALTCNLELIPQE